MLRLQSTEGYLGSLPEFFSTSWKKQPKHVLKTQFQWNLCRNLVYIRRLYKLFIGKSQIQYNSLSKMHGIVKSSSKTA